MENELYAKIIEKINIREKNEKKSTFESSISSNVGFFKPFFGPV
jgi:hypothetical protein